MHTGLRMQCTLGSEALCIGVSRRYTRGSEGDSGVLKRRLMCLPVGVGAGKERSRRSAWDGRRRPRWHRNHRTD